MIRRRLSLIAMIGLALPTSAGAAWSAQPAGASQAASADGHVSSTVIPGVQAYPPTPPVQGGPRQGDVSLNFPAVDVRDLAKAVLGDLLGATYRVEPAATGSVTLVTAQPIARADILRAFEDALRASNLVLLRRGGAYVIAPTAEARGQAPILAVGETGFGSETIELRFIAAAELKKLLDPILPDTLSITDPSRNVITLTGGTGQRQSAHDLITQFDVDWLKGMSFGLYVPQHTDSRILVPEIDKLLNGQGAPSAGLVRLIAMEKINGVLAISAQPQYLDDVKRWIEVLDREGESSERRLFVYRVQNGRSSDLASVLNVAFGANPGGRGGGAVGAANSAAPPSTAAGFDIDPSSISAGPNANGAANGGGVTPSRSGGGATESGATAATISSDETNNAVLAYATPRQYAVIEDALRKLDIAPIQVLIEAAVAEVTLTHALQYGVQWSFNKGHDTTNLLSNTGGVTTPSSSVATGATTGQTIGQALGGIAQTLPGLSYLHAGASITATLNALSGLTTVNVLSAPKMLVLNNHTASLEVGDQVPVVTGSSVSTFGTNAPVVNSVEYRDTGVILKVTPRVNSGGLVLLDVAQEVSDVVTTSTSSINSPTIEQRKFATSIAIQDGETIALGGLIRDNRTKSRSGIPFLNSIPILGALAGTQGGSDQRTELLILLTPRVIHNTADAESITDELRRKIQAIEPIQPLKSLHP